MSRFDEKYYKQHGTTLGRSAKIIELDRVGVPAASIVHYVGVGHSGWYPTEMELSAYVDSHYMGHVLELTKVKGNPKTVRSSAIKRAPNPLRKPIQAVPRNYSVVLNYVGLNRMKYSKSVLGVWRSSNVLNTLVDKINDIAENNTRTHYIVLDAPNRDISRTEYDRLAKMSNAVLNKKLKSGNEWIMLQLHMWLIGESSLFSMLPFGDVDVVLLIRNRGKHVVVSMNYLDSMIAADKPEAFGVTKQKLSSSAMHGVVSSMLLDLSESITPVEQEEPEDVVEEVTVDDIADIISKTKPVDTKPVTTKAALKNHLDALSDTNRITAKQYKKMVALSERELPNGFNDQNLDTYAKITEADVKLKSREYIKSDTIQDKSMNSSVTADYENRYITVVKDKHMASVISSFQTGGLVVNKHEITQLANITGSADVHKLSVTMSDGNTSTITMRLPTLAPDGTYVINGVEYRMRKQRVDLPIRKISHNITQLSSYYGVKQFVTRSELATDDPYSWISKKLYERSIDNNDDLKAVMGDSYDNHNIVPNVYGQLSRHITKVKTPKYEVSFDYKKRETYGPDKSDKIAIGKHKLGVMYMSNAGIISAGSNSIGTVYDLFELQGMRRPKSGVFVKIAGKRVYIAALLGYLIGMSKLLKLLDVKVDVVKARARVPDGALVIPLSNCKLVVSQSDTVANLILSGFLKYRTRDLTYKDMDSRAGYEAMLADADIMKRQTSEYELINDMFLDPITKEYLERMKEPTVYIPLLIRAVELLTTTDHPDTADAQRIRGYERFPGAAYSEMVKSIRDARTKNNVTSRKIEMSPFAVWSKIKNDSANKITENTNPIMQLRDVEAVILSGDGGRSSDTLTIDARKYHRNDVGMLSESVPDNGDVGLVSFLTANPRINTTYGDAAPHSEFKKGNMAQFYSTSAAITPGADHDDPKRKNFIGIQNQHTMAIRNMELPYVRSGYESVLPQRLSDIYATIAEQPGKVMKVNDHGMVIKYKDGTVVGIELGTRYSRAEGALYPNDVMTNLTKGAAFKKGYPIAYHSGFFEQDIWDNGNLLYKQSRMITTALYEGSMTFEDSCTLDVSVMDDLTSAGIKVKEYLITFDQSIHSAVKVGQEVKVGDTLFVLEEETTSGSDFDGTVVDALMDLDAQHIKSKVSGTIDRIECIYNGTMADMSPSLTTLTKKSNDKLKQIAEATGRTYYSGQVDSEYSYKGTPLQPDTCEVRVYTRLNNVPANGDKFVLGLQLKCTVSDVTNGIRTVSGTLVEAGFSGISVGARIVGSYNEVTVLSTLLKHLPKKLLEINDA